MVATAADDDIRWSYVVEWSVVTTYIRHDTAATEHGILLDIGQFHRTLRGDRVNPSPGRHPIGC